MESANAILPGQTLGRYAEHDGTQKLDDLLKREDIEAVIVAYGADPSIFARRMTDLLLP